MTATAWQDGGLVVNRLEKAGPGLYRTTEPIPVTGDWKALIRVHEGRQLIGVPVYLPEDAAIPAKEVPAPKAAETRAFSRDSDILQREQKPGVAGWLKVAAPLVVLFIALMFSAALAWGVGRVGRTRTATDTATPPRYRPVAPRPTAVA